MPGTYTVALTIDGKTIDSKPLTVTMDPLVQMTDAARAKYNAVLMDLHALQGQGTEMTSTLTALGAEVGKAVTKVDSSSAPANVKADFAAFRKDFDATRAKFGLGVPAVTFGGPGGGFGGGGGAPSPNVLGRVGTIKAAIMSVWEVPSDATMRQVADVKAAVPEAIKEATALMKRARSMSATLAEYKVTMLVP